MQIARSLDQVTAALLNHVEIIANIDQDPCHVAHVGRLTPCILASISFMWGFLHGRTMTAGELLTAQQVPIYPQTAEWAGFPEVPLDTSVANAIALRRMAGNSFNQTCAVAFLVLTLAEVSRVQGDQGQE